MKYFPPSGNEAGEAVDADASSGPTMYSYGNKDGFTVFFYFLICIVLHAVIQEYLLDVSVIEKDQSTQEINSFIFFASVLDFVHMLLVICLVRQV